MMREKVLSTLIDVLLQYGRSKGQTIVFMHRFELVQLV